MIRDQIAWRFIEGDWHVGALRNYFKTLKYSVRVLLVVAPPTTTSTTVLLHQRMTIWVNPDSLCKLPKHKPYGVWLLNLCSLL